VRKKIKLHIKDKRESFGGNIKRPYFLFLEMGEKQFVFSNKVKAQKWLVTFENNLNTLIQELILNIPKLYNYNTLLSLNMDFPKQRNMRENLNYSMECYWRIYNSNYVTAIGKEVNNIYYEIEEQLEFYKKLLGRSSRNQALLTQIKTEIKHSKYLKNEINALFDVDKVLLSLGRVEKTKTINQSELYLRIA
jgi:hypothetical protein